MKTILITLFTILTLSVFSQQSPSPKIIGISRYQYRFYSIDLRLKDTSDYQVYIMSPLNDTIKLITLSKFQGMYGYILDLSYKPNGEYEVIVNKKDTLIDKFKFILQ